MFDSPQFDDLTHLISDLEETDLDDLIQLLPSEAYPHLTELLGPVEETQETPGTPSLFGSHVDPDFQSRPHLEKLSDVFTQALRDVEAGKSRRIIVEMPPRYGKTYLATMILAAWILAQHPDWPIMLTSHDGSLAVSWGRQVRRWALAGLLGDKARVRADSNAAGEWETEGGGIVLSRSVRESLTGRGAKILLVDDPHKDFVEAHSPKVRETIWNWWLSVAQTRLQHPSLVVVTATRWHEDDLIGRILSDEYPGDPGEWEVVRLPALAEEGDLLGREVGEPLLSPLLVESRDEAVARLAGVRESVGEYTWAAMYQQRPAPAEGVIFNPDWWRFWTSDLDAVTDDGRVVLLPVGEFHSGRMVDSWDLTFSKSSTSDFVVGQRWVRVGADRFLLAQQRGRWEFTEQLEAMRQWAKTDDDALSPFGGWVGHRLVEKAANGAALLSTLAREVSGLKPVTPLGSKEMRARAITPEVESGHVFLPHPGMPGFEWVNDFLSEFRNFPNDAHDDQVDAATQALLVLRDGSGSTQVHSPTGTVRRAYSGGSLRDAGTLRGSLGGVSGGARRRV